MSFKRSIQPKFLHNEGDSLVENYPQNYAKVHSDIMENENDLIVKFDLPGIEDKDDIHIQLDNRELIVQSHIEKTEEKEDEQVYYKERYEGKLYRSITLPLDVEQDQIKVTYKNGVLKIRLKKQMEETNNRVEVNFED